MKKSLIFAGLLGVSAISQAQLQSKKGEAYLPEAGDWSIGVDATPFLNYVGNFLSSAGNSAPTQDFLNANQTIIGKYCVTQIGAPLRARPWAPPGHSKSFPKM